MTQSQLERVECKGAVWESRVGELKKPCGQGPCGRPAARAGGFPSGSMPCGSMPCGRVPVGAAGWMCRFNQRQRFGEADKFSP